MFGLRVDSVQGCRWMKEGRFSPRSLQYRKKASTVPADSVGAGRHSRDMLANPRRALGGTQGSQGEAGTLSLRLPKAPPLLHDNGLCKGNALETDEATLEP